MARGLAEARWPCRLERVLNAPPVIVDVAHNAAGMMQLAEGLDKAVVVLAVAADKDAEAMIDAIAPVAGHLILTQFDGRRAMPVDALRAAAGERPHESFATLGEAIERGISLARGDIPLVITGSIFAAGEARNYLMEHHGASPLRF